MKIFEVMSIVIAVVGLSFAIYEGRLNRKYHRISLKPKLVIRKHLGGSRGQLGFSVTNEGSGVALINNCEVIVKGRIMTPNSSNGWENAIKELGLPKDKGHIGYTVVAPGGAIAAGKWTWLLYTDVNDDFRISLVDAIDNFDLDIKIIYESIFQEKDVAYLHTGKLTNI